MTEKVQEPKKYRLPKKFAKKFINILRSGKYTQTKDSLVTINKEGKYCYCVLGVAGKIQGCIMRPDIDGSLTELPEGQDDSYSTNVKGIANVPKELHGSKPFSLPSILMGMNDSGKTFTEIADWIQESVEFYEEPTKPEQLNLYETSNESN